MAKSGEEKQPIAYADVVNSKKILLWIRKLSTVWVSITETRCTEIPCPDKEEQKIQVYQQTLDQEGDIHL